MPLVRLYSAEDTIEAHLLKHMLEQQDIACFITGEHLESAAGELPAMGLVDVWVLDIQIDDAQDVLEDFFDTLDDPEFVNEDGGDDVDAGAGDPPALPHDSPDNPWNRVYRKKP